MGIIKFFKKNWPFYIALIPVLVVAVECVPIIQSHFSSYWWMVVIVMTLAACLIAGLLAKFLYRLRDRNGDSLNLSENEEKGNEK